MFNTMLQKENTITKRFLAIEILLFIITTIIGFLTHSLGVMPILYLLYGFGFIYKDAIILMAAHVLITTILYVTAFFVQPDILFSHTDFSGFLLNMIVFYSGCTGAALYGHLLSAFRSNEHAEKSRLSSLLTSTEAQKKMIEESSLSKSYFFANLSHDIRTNINTICGMSELLSQNSNMSSLENEYIDTLQTAAHTLLNTVTDILDYSEIDAGQLELFHMKYNLFSCLREIQNTVMMQLGNSNIAFLLHVSPTMPYQFYGDETRIRQVVLTLLNNAVQFTKCGTISLDVEYKKTDEDCGTIRMTVSDTGCGIPEDKQKSLFSQFHTPKSGSSESTPELGLIIARKLARLMDGDLTFESTVNKGTTFTFTIQQQVYSGFPLTESASYEHCHILVYEPDKYYAHAISQLLGELQTVYHLYETPSELLTAIVDEADTYIFFDYNSGKDMLLNALTSLKLTTVAALIDINVAPADTPGNLLFIPKPLNFFSLVPVLDKKQAAFSGKKEKKRNPFIAPEARILIVDDNRVNLRVAKGLISSFKCDITTVTSGREALSLIEQGEIFDLIFMDHMMPDLDGIETTKIIRDMPSPYAQQVPIIALTANTINGARELFIENEMNDFLAKPIEMDRLNQIMDEFIDPEKKIALENNA